MFGFELNTDIHVILRMNCNVFWDPQKFHSAFLMSKFEFVFTYDQKPEKQLKYCALGATQQTLACWSDMVNMVNIIPAKHQYVSMLT